MPGEDDEPTPDALWDLPTVAEYLGVRPGTVRSYLARGQMPLPDMRFGRSSVWRAKTIKDWHEGRPSQQGED